MDRLLGAHAQDLQVSHAAGGDPGVVATTPQLSRSPSCCVRFDWPHSTDRWHTWTRGIPEKFVLANFVTQPIACKSACSRQVADLMQSLVMQ